MDYGAPMKARRQRIKIGQGTSQYQGEAIVLGTTDDITGQTTRSQGAAPQTAKQDFVLQVPVTRGLKNLPINSTAFMLTVPDGDIAGGNARGLGAIDLQYYRTAATQVASGNNSVLI